jgi:hypothetical protein
MKCPKCGTDVPKEKKCSWFKHSWSNWQERSTVREKSIFGFRDGVLMERTCIMCGLKQFKAVTPE